MKKYMMATKAIHKLGDISSDYYDLCFITHEDETNYIGNWVTGLGFVNVKFPKKTTRNLTPKEVKHFNDFSYQLGNNPPIKLNISSEEN